MPNGDYWRNRDLQGGRRESLLPGGGNADLNRSVHFNSATYSTLREDALSALKTLGRVIQLQFGGFGRQPWFIENTPGAQFIRRT
jgi:hypothetical protein